MMISMLRSVLGRIGSILREAADDESGIGVVEVILILVEILTRRYMYI